MTSYFISEVMNMTKQYKITIQLILLLVFCMLCGCSNTGNKPPVNSGNNVDAVINAQINNELEEKSQASTESVDTTEDSEDTSQVTTESTAENATTTTEELTAATYVPAAPDDNSDVIEPNSNETGIDYDLTIMDKNMVYSTVYQLMVNPSAYEGKVIRIEGKYYGTYYEENERYYHYCIIQDALGCCAQGMEFVWEDGSHTYPDEYPAEDTIITVTGTFESYHEKSENFVYVRLANATMTINE